MWPFGSALGVLVALGGTPSGTVEDSAGDGASIAGANAAHGSRVELERTFGLHVRPFLERHCTWCHSGSGAEGGLDLDRFESLLAVERDLARWRLVSRRVELDQMPPLGPLPPSTEERAMLAAFTDKVAAVRYDPTMPADRGPRPLRRLARREVARTLWDVLGIRPDLSGALPEDQVSEGFDHIAGSQPLPPAAVEAWAEFSARVPTLAMPRLARRAGEPPQRVRVEGDRLPRGGELYSNGDVPLELLAPHPGRYRMRAGLAADQVGSEYARAALRAGAKELMRSDVRSTRGAGEDVLEAEFELRTAGRETIAVRFLNDLWQPEAPDPRQRDRNLVVRWIEWEGPVDEPEASVLESELTARFGDLEFAESQVGALEHLLLLLWRRPPEPGAAADLLELAHPDGPAGERLLTALTAALVSPRFLFRLESDPLDGYDRASRLAYFLWSSAPDEPLLRAAAQGDLDSVAGRRTQVRRMLADPRSRALAEDFAPQWLALRRLEQRASSVGAEEGALYRDMIEESVRNFAAQLADGAPLEDLLLSRHAHLNRGLAAHYQVPWPGGDGWLRLEVDGRRGLLGQAAVLTATSESTRTSVVARGLFVLDQLLGEPPPPPPPLVPSLDPVGEDHAAIDFVQRLEHHRRDPNCAVCHEQMDSLGLALEAFGPRGEIRELARPLRGQLPDGTVLSGMDDLIAFLLADDRFVRTLTERLLVHGLGRALVPSDRGEVARIVADLDPRTATLADLLYAVSESVPLMQ